MTEQSFSLVPFPAPEIQEITIQGAIARQNNLLALHYLVAGNLKELSLPCRSRFPSRKHELWKATCFEFFLAIANQPQYWEFNLSPSGDWNVYHMDAYRRIGFREETSIQELPFEVQISNDRFALSVTVDLGPIIQPGDFLEVGIAVIIHSNHGQETYWALTHPTFQPDFHWRESFTLWLAAQPQPSGQSAPGD